MLARRVLSFLAVVAVGCELCLPFAGAQGAPGISSGIKPITFQIPSQEQTKSRELRQGPVTPAELALKAAQQNVSKSHPFGSRSLSSGNSIFLAALDFNSAGQNTRSVAAADLNNDGSADLVTADSCSSSNNCTTGSVSVLLGNGDGTFQPAVSYGSGGEGADAVAIGDVNGDGRPDVVVANNCATNNNCSNGSVSVLLGNGDGTFQPAVNYSSAGLEATYVAIADVNGDAKADVIVANNCVDNSCINGTVSVLLGNGDGTFQPAVAYNSGGRSAMFIAVGDLNGDGKLDLAVTNQCVSNSNCSNSVVGVLLGKGDGTFNSAINYSAGGVYSNSVAIGDVNGDGHPDLTVSNQCNNSSQCSNGSLSVLLGNGDGTFQAAVDYASGGEDAMAMVLTDINGDGKLDLLVTNQTDSNGNWMDGSVASVLLGNGDGTFQPAVSYSSGEVQGTSIAFADVNGDGKADFIMANACSDNYACTTGAVSVFLGNGDGTLRGGIDYNSDAWSAYSVAIADVNGDGKLDLLVGSQCASNSSCTNGTASVLLGNGDGTFQPAVTYNTGGQSLGIAAADVNGDGKLDLLLANTCTNNNCSNGGSASVLLGNGDGTFQPQVTYGSSGLQAYSLAVGDVNGDGKPDLIISNECSDNTCSNASLGVLLGNGDGTFQTAVSYSTGGVDAFSVATADVNGDGKLDLVVANQCASNNNCTNGVISVLLGNGDGTFQAPVTYNSGGFYSYTVAIGDVNGDGHPDLVVTNQCGNNNSCTTGSIAVLLGNGDGTFQAATTTVTPVISDLQTIVLADFNGDHKLDVAAAGANILLLGNGDGTFQSPVALGARGAGMAVGDLNGDGRPDLAVGGVVVLLNVSGGFVLPTTTTVASSVNPSPFGGSVTFIATIAAAVSGTPTGTVTFSDGSTTLGQATVNAGIASYATASLATGSHSITATYSGDSSFTGSVSTALSQVVQKVNTTTALNAPRSANVNQSITFTATVTPGTSGAPTGTVNFLDGTTQIGNASPNGSGVATFSTSTLAMGTHSVTAVYGGDSNFNGSTSTAASVVVTNSGFSLSSSVLSPASIVPGGSGQSTITITPAGGLNPSTVSLSCSVSPVVSPAVTCSSGTISVTGGTGTATLSVGTTGPHAALAPPAERGLSKLIALALLIPGLFFCGAGLNNPKRRKLLAIGFVFLVLTGCMFQTACTGVSSPSTTTAGTPAGTYTVTATGSVTGMPHETTSVVVTVQ